MKITLLAYGSRGDIQPFLALAVGLQKAGHFPLLAAPHRFSAFVEGYQIPFHPLPGDPEEISARFNDAGQNPVATVRAISDYVFKIAPQVSQSAMEACTGADLIIHGFLFTAGGHAFACQQGIPDISVQTFPMFAPTKAFPNVSAAGIPPGWLSYGSHWLFDRVFRYGGNAGYRRIRRLNPELPLPASIPWPFEDSPQRPRTPLLFAFSPHVIPPPREWQGKASIHLPGYFFLEEPDYDPPRLVADFLAAGEPPVCITFGSMVNRQMERISAALLEALHRIRKRAVILTGWGDWGQKKMDEQVLMLESMPHAWLFPRCRLIIHHGGAGTTAAALRSGVPSMIVPLAGDQPFWAKVVDRLAVGPRSIRLKDLTAAGMEQVLQNADAPDCPARAWELGKRLREEDGVGNAVRLVEQTALKDAG